MNLALVIEQLNASHDRQAFACGIPALDRYLREQANQDVRRRLGNCFVAVDREAEAIAGFYTLAASSIPMTALPEADARRLPRYSVLPATLVGRLAVDLRFQERQVGSALIIDAVRRSAQAAPASYALLVEAKDEGAAGFYRKHGFMSLSSRPLSYFLPIGTALKLFGE